MFRWVKSFSFFPSQKSYLRCYLMSIQVFNNVINAYSLVILKNIATKNDAVVSVVNLVMWDPWIYPFYLCISHFSLYSKSQIVIFGLSSPFYSNRMIFSWVLSLLCNIHTYLYYCKKRWQFNDATILYTIIRLIYYNNH